MSNFKEIEASELSFSPFDLKNKWMLVTAAKADGSVNTMTASWGGFGVMWNKDVVFVVIRPQRYTKEFVDNADSFSLTFFDESFKKQLGYLGRASGRDENKIETAGLTVAKDNTDTPYFEESETAILVEKLFVQPLSESSFLDEKIIDQWYSEKDFHYLYIAEIRKVLIKK
ncbi:flavin reductase family protein [Dysgonomonas sp. 520]|uniref:flavin reductase family protein n=1 Tax=Dysgonomonas sp. 520 TaxID=2302931 RepID=UPI0013D68EE5|nr:flavin reductase [Dysgonomonas sp. 520]NDW09260.1 flavin reductase family protein [Dysgonomonas sp. 520]